MYRRSFLAPALLLCLWTGAISDVAWAQAPAPASDPSQATPAPAVPPSEKAAEPAQSPSPAPGDKPAAPAPQPAVPEPQAAAPQPGPATVGTLPPASSPPLVRFIELTFPTQGNQSVIDPQTYVYYIQTQISRPSAGVWIPYNEKTEQSLLEDFKRLWGTNFLDNLSIEVVDDNWPNGVVGRRIIFKMEERQRVKIVDYLGTKKIEQSKIDEKLKEDGVTIRLDSFVDPTTIAKVETIVRGMMAEKGYQFAKVTHEIEELPTGPKLVHLSFHIDDGPKVRIKKIDFIGNKALTDGELEHEMKDNRSESWLSFINGHGTYNETKFEDDADKIQEHYANKGYMAAHVGAPEMKVLEDTKDGSKRYIQLNIPVTEGDRYKVGSLNFDGNKVIKSEALRPLFKMNEGDYYSLKKIQKGIEQMRDAYGTGGYWEFTSYPDMKPRNMPDASKMNDPAALEAAKKQPAILDITMNVKEGEQYFVNRITFVGNTTTLDSVVRREVRLLENGVFNTEALKFSIKKINQLGYFKEIEGGPDNPKVEKVPGQKNKVDVTLKVQEQNRNQLTFGAGVSQYEGFFGQLSFSTQNFLGRGESVTFAVMAGTQVQNYQLAFAEPYVFDRPITAGVNLYKREIQYYLAYTEDSTGGNLTMGFPVRDFTRLFLTYTLEVTKVKDVNPAYLDPGTISRNPFLADALLVNQGGARTISQITPSLVHNTIDNPIFPNAGKRFTLSSDFAGAGGDVFFLKPHVEGVWWKPTSRKTTFGVRGQVDYLEPYGSTDAITMPIYERLFLGGEYSVRGYDIRTIGPRDPVTFVVLGGNKDVLFNAEYHYTIAGPFRVLGYFDAGQVKDFGQAFAIDSFKMSTGAEVRFFMPVLNVPFRLIYAHNMNREGMYDNNLVPAKANTFKFAVGSTF
jgi:outer membrane protein insertion porin family